MRNAVQVFIVFVVVVVSAGAGGGVGGAGGAGGVDAAVAAVIHYARSDTAHTWLNVVAKKTAKVLYHCLCVLVQN